MFGPKMRVRRLARRDLREGVGLVKRGPGLGCRVMGRIDGSDCGASESYLSKKYIGKHVVK